VAGAHEVISGPILAEKKVEFPVDHLPGQAIQWGSPGEIDYWVVPQKTLFGRFRKGGDPEWKNRPGGMVTRLLPENNFQAFKRDADDFKRFVTFIDQDGRIIVENVVFPDDPPAIDDIQYEKEILITSEEVINSSFAMNEWNFGDLLKELSAKVDEEEIGEFIGSWLDEFEEGKEIPTGGFTNPVRDVSALRRGWSQSPGGQLSFTNAPFRLVGVVNRLDLTRFEDNDPAKNVEQLGEGRLVYQWVPDQQGGPFPRSFTLIAEFTLPELGGLGKDASVLKWAERWHDLGALNGDDYLRHLNGIVEDFAKRGNLNQLRTNEIEFSPHWELREFKFDAAGKLVLVPPAQTPHHSFSGTEELGGWILDNSEGLIDDTRIISAREDLGNGPEKYLGSTSEMVGNSPDFRWSLNSTGMSPEQSTTAREAFSRFALNTCSGCHGGHGGSPFFQHMRLEQVSPSRTRVSDFLTGDFLVRHPGLNVPINEKVQRMTCLTELLKKGGLKRQGKDVQYGANSYYREVVKERANREH